MKSKLYYTEDRESATYVINIFKEISRSVVDRHFNTISFHAEYAF